MQGYRFLTFLLCGAMLGAPLCYAQDQAAAPLPPAPDEEVRMTKSVTEANNKDKDKFISLSFENDSIGGGTDEAYTNGLRLTYFDAGTPVPVYMDRLADLVPTFDLNASTSTFFTFGQNIYTPSDLTQNALISDDRPYAGWLYGSVGVVTADDQHLDSLELTLGVVGPEALGEQVQSEVHNLINVQDPKGWDNQLEFEPGAILSWRRRWPAALDHTAHGFRVRVEPDVNLSLGNIYTYAGTGARVTFGPYQGEVQDTPPRVPPASAGTGYFDTPDGGYGWLLFASLDGRAVGRNIFLDGNTFTDSHSVDKRYFVADASVGVSVTLRDYRLSYTLTGRSKEFKGQQDPALFGSLTLSKKF